MTRKKGDSSLALFHVFSSLLHYFQLQTTLDEISVKISLTLAESSCKRLWPPVSPRAQVGGRADGRTGGRRMERRGKEGGGGGGAADQA